MNTMKDQLDSVLSDFKRIPASPKLRNGISSKKRFLMHRMSNPRCSGLTNEPLISSSAVKIGCESDRLASPHALRASTMEPSVLAAALQRMCGKTESISASKARSARLEIGSSSTVEGQTSYFQPVGRGPCCCSWSRISTIG